MQVKRARDELTETRDAMVAMSSLVYPPPSQGYLTVPFC